MEPLLITLISINLIKLLNEQNIIFPKKKGKKNKERTMFSILFHVFFRQITSVENKFVICNVHVKNQEREKIALRDRKLRERERLLF